MQINWEGLVLLLSFLVNGVVTLHNININKKLKRAELENMESINDKLMAETTQSILQSFKTISDSYKQFIADVETRNKERDARITFLESSLERAEEEIITLTEKNDTLERISMATCAGVELLIAQLKKEEIVPVWEVSPELKNILPERRVD